MTPDGSWLLWESESIGAGGTSSDSIWLMRRSTGGASPEKVLELAAPGDVLCSSNPKASSPCVLSQHEGKDLVFYSLDPVRGKGSRLGKIEVVGRYTGWCVSPDGSRLALVDQDKYEGRIEALALADGAWHEVPLKPGGEHLQSIAWAADGKRARCHLPTVSTWRSRLSRGTATSG